MSERDEGMYPIFMVKQAYNMLEPEYQEQFRNVGKKASVPGNKIPVVTLCSGTDGCITTMEDSWHTLDPKELCYSLSLSSGLSVLAV